MAQVYRRQVEQLQQALDHPEIRDEAVQILRDSSSAFRSDRTEYGLEIEIVGKIAKMVELGVNEKLANLNERLVLR
ncbi:MAG TPA: hypothetical protein VFR60_02585 [Sphingomicrobium sp.]|nr:hypothetical protein [Sphingomicrobium sp.]